MSRRDSLTKLLAFPEQAARVLKRGKVRSEDEFCAVLAYDAREADEGLLFDPRVMPHRTLDATPHE